VHILLNIGSVQGLFGLLHHIGVHVVLHMLGLLIYRQFQLGLDFANNVTHLHIRKLHFVYRLS
jgi:hypothetical protein